MIKTLIGFAIGLGVGSIASIKIYRKKIDHEANEEVKEVIDRFTEIKYKLEMDYESKLEQMQQQIDKNEAKVESVEDLEQEYINSEEEVKTESKYVDYSHYSEDTVSKIDELYVDPYVITTDEFGEYDDYEQSDLLLFDGGTLAYDDDDKTKVVDVEELVGTDALETPGEMYLQLETYKITSGEYGNDFICVRNDNIKTDFRITKQYVSYSSIKEGGN